MTVLIIWPFEGTREVGVCDGVPGGVEEGVGVIEGVGNADWLALG
jgi:hypothetical protein